MSSAILTDRKLSMRAKPAIQRVNEFITQSIDFENWLARTDVRIMFFQKNEQGQYVGYCDCGKSTMLENPKSGETTVCPHCDSKVKLRAVRYGDYKGHFCVSVLERDIYNKGFIQRYFVCHRTVSVDTVKLCMGILHCVVKQKNVLVEEGRYYLDWDWGKVATYHKCYGKSEWRAGRTIKHGMGWSGWRCDEMLQRTYPNNLQDVIDDTPYKYSALDIACKELLVDGIDYLRIWHDEPMLEMLLKLGLIGVARDYLYYHDTWDSTRQKRVEAIKKIKTPKDLGLRTADDLGECRHKGIFEIYAYNEIKKWKITQEQHESALKFLVMVFERRGMEQFKKEIPISLERLYTYWQSQEDYAQNPSYFISDYSDYIEQCKALNYDLNNTAVKTPRDFRQMHSNTSVAYKAHKSEILNKAIKRVYNTLHSVLEWTDGELSVVMPKTQDAIIREGKNQNHCVGTYCERVAKGSCVILFIRKNTAKRKAYYTMEIRPDMAKFSMVQCRGLRNADTTEDVNAFLKKYERWFNSRPVKAA